jgi:hypothetical protein
MSVLKDVYKNERVMRRPSSGVSSFDVEVGDVFERVLKVVVLTRFVKK